jgi:hypothetical protein
MRKTGCGAIHALRHPHNANGQTGRSASGQPTNCQPTTDKQLAHIAAGCEKVLTAAHQML